MTHRHLPFLVTIASVSFPMTPQAQTLLQSSCFQASFGRAGLAAEGPRISAAEIEWFDATDQIVTDAGALRPETEADAATRAALAALAPSGLQGRRFLAAQITVRLQGKPAGEGPESDSAICTPADDGLRCRLLCDGAGEFFVRIDRQSRAEVRPGAGGMTLNVCGTEIRRVRILPKSAPAMVLRRQNYDVCGVL